MSLHGDGGNMSAESGSFLMPKRDPLYIVVPMIIMYSVIFVTGVIGNSITCLVIAKHKYMHTATNYYLFSLAVSDLILLVSGLPQEMWSIWSKYPYIFGEIFCQLRGLFAEMSANATVLTITAFTAERYVAICHPFMAQSMSKLSRAVKLIVIIWLVAVMFAIPQALQFTVSSYDGMPEVTQCNIKTIQLMDTDVKLSTVSFTLSTLLFFVLPMTFITVLYALIGLRLRRSDKLKRTITVRSSCGEKKISSPEYRANSSSKVLKMLVAVVVAFFICWAPFHAQRLIAIFWSNHASSKDEDIPFLHQLYGITTYVSGVLYYMSTTINPILYHIMSLKFRTAFKCFLFCTDRKPCYGAVAVTATDGQAVGANSCGGSGVGGSCCTATATHRLLERPITVSAAGGGGGRSTDGCPAGRRPLPSSCRRTETARMSAPVRPQPGRQRPPPPDWPSVGGAR
ncbi:pyrokinin-1 receptor-like isoform X2 [Sipha flava]|uniref:Pyrokinin-1 receptor-like isoform X2 n=1 Tax=Sipha flava TaxID=143950 RepID=A0A8B8F3N2_9HEMI|nr:pyrokinin-1 receptor-like isoform X2 [Sipha flava]